MPTIKTRQLADGGERYFIRFRDPDNGKESSAAFMEIGQAERFLRDRDERGLAWALAEYRRTLADAEDDDEYTLDEWAELHFASQTRPTEGSKLTYRRIYATKWSPTIGHYRLSQLDRITISTALLQIPGSDKTVKNAWGVLTTMLKMAVVDGYLTRSPHVGIKLPENTGHETPDHRYLTEEEFWQLLNDTPEYWRPFVTFLAGTGVRWGEAAALLVGDIVLGNNPAVRVTKAEKADPSKALKKVGPTKTKKGRRTVTLPIEVVEALLPLLEGRKSNERLFLPPKGGPLRHHTFYRDIWCRKSTVNIPGPRPRIHDLRHSHVAWLMANGAPLTVIQARLGHEKIGTTWDVYGHLEPDLQRAAATAAGQVFSRKPRALGAAS